MVIYLIQILVELQFKIINLDFSCEQKFTLVTESWYFLSSTRVAWNVSEFCELKQNLSNNKIDSDHTNTLPIQLLYDNNSRVRQRFTSVLLSHKFHNL